MKNNNKKNIILIAVVIILITVLTACSKETSKTEAVNTAEPAGAEKTNEEPAANKAVTAGNWGTPQEYKGDPEGRATGMIAVPDGKGKDIISDSPYYMAVCEAEGVNFKAHPIPRRAFFMYGFTSYLII